MSFTLMWEKNDMKILPPQSRLILECHGAGGAVGGRSQQEVDATGRDYAGQRPRSFSLFIGAGP